MVYLKNSIKILEDNTGEISQKAEPKKIKNGKGEEKMRKLEDKFTSSTFR